MSLGPLVGPYSKVIQMTIGPSNYFKSHREPQDYIEHATFLPILNNEREHSQSRKFKRRFEALNFLTLVKFAKDPIVFPRESSWFGEVNPDGQVIPMEETTIFKENKFGLKTLFDQKRLEKKEIDGVHLQFVNEHIQEVFVQGLLK